MEIACIQLEHLSNALESVKPQERLERIRKLALTRDIESIRTRVRQGLIRWQCQARIFVPYVPTQRAPSAHRLPDVHVSQCLHQKAILRPSDIALLHQSRACVVDNAAIRGLREGFSVKEYGAEEDDGGLGRLDHHCIL